MAPPVHAETQKALIYNIGEASGTPRFTQETKIEPRPGGEKKWSSKIVDANGALVMTETAEIKNNRIAHQFIEQLQINEAYELEMVGDKAIFTTYAIVDGKRGPIKEKNSISTADNFITGPLSVPFLQKNWDTLLNGKTVSANFGIFEISRSVDFDFALECATDQTIKVKMKPTSFFISLLVEPIYIELSKNDKKIVRFRGRTPLRELIRGKWKPIDAEILYL